MKSLELGEFFGFQRECNTQKFKSLRNNEEDEIERFIDEEGEAKRRSLIAPCYLVNPDSPAS